MKIGFYQFEPRFGDVGGNLAQIEAAVQTNIDLLILPELCTCGYQFVTKEELAAVTEEIPAGPSVQYFIELARKISGTVVAGMPEKDGNNFYNSAVIVNDSGNVAKYRKLHLFFEEKFFFQPGNLPLPVIDIGLAKIGVMICFDWIFPEAARTLSLQGADILCLPANLVLPHCQKAMVTRAIENQVFTVVANRIGTEAQGGKKELHFTGGSQVAAPDGEILLAATPDKSELLTVDIDPNQARDKWVTTYNHVFSDRRTGYYWLEGGEKA